MSVSKALAHGLTYTNVPVATPSCGALILEQKLLCSMVRPSTQRYICVTTWGLQDAYEKDTLPQNMHLPLGEPGV